VNKKLISRLNCEEGPGIRVDNGPEFLSRGLD